MTAPKRHRPCTLPVITPAAHNAICPPEIKPKQPPVRAALAKRGLAQRGKRCLNAVADADMTRGETGGSSAPHLLSSGLSEEL